MTRFSTTLGLTLILSAQALAGDAGHVQAGSVMIHDGWARASLGKAPNSAAYMTLMIDGDAADTLIAVSTPAADRAELHNHVMEDGIARMRPVDAVEIAPGEPTVLEPGGLHVMLMGLTAKLEAGADLTLTFENAGEVTLDLPIQGLRGGMKQGGAHKHGD